MARISFRCGRKKISIMAGNVLTTSPVTYDIQRKTERTVPLTGSISNLNRTLNAFSNAPNNKSSKSPLKNISREPLKDKNQSSSQKSKKENAANTLDENKENVDPNFNDMFMAILSDTLSTSLKFKDTSSEVKTSRHSKQSAKDETQSKTIEALPRKRPFTVSVEGNIGSGKSTFLKYFSTFPQVATYQEPLHKWTDVGGYNLLGKLYEDPKRWSFLFQSYVQLTRLNIHLSNEQSDKVKLIERSLHNNRYCFVENGHDSGDLQEGEYNVLCEYFDFLEENLDLGVDLIVYLRTSPEVVHERMRKRGRTEEAGVPLAYLKKVHEYYERWLMDGTPRQPPAPVLVIDANTALEQVKRSYELHMPFIMGETTYGDKTGEPGTEPELTSEVEASEASTGPTLSETKKTDANEQCAKTDNSSKET